MSLLTDTLTHSPINAEPKPLEIEQRIFRSVFALLFVGPLRKGFPKFFSREGENKVLSANFNGLYLRNKKSESVGKYVKLKVILCSLISYKLYPKRIWGSWNIGKNVFFGFLKSRFKGVILHFANPFYTHCVPFFQQFHLM